MPSEHLRRDVGAKRLAFIDEIKSIAPDRLIFIDESGCNIAMSPTYGLGPRGQRVIDHKPGNWGDITSASSVPCAPTGLAHQTFDGAVNGPKFIDFVRRRLVSRLYPGDVVVLDHLRAYHAPEVRSLMEQAGARLLFPSPYAPDFSPIEPCWAFLKLAPDAQGARPCSAQGCDRMGLRRATTRHLASWFIHCGYSSVIHRDAKGQRPTVISTRARPTAGTRVGKTPS